MTDKRKAVISTCAASTMGMIALTTTAVLAYIIKDYAMQGVAVPSVVAIMTIQPLVGVFMAFLSGPISMRVSKKLILMISLLLVIINGVIMSFFGGACDYHWLWVVGALTGVVSGFLSTVPNSVVGKYAETWEERGKFTGWNNAALQGGALVLSAVGGILGANGWQHAYYLYFIAVPMLLVVLILCPSDKPEKIEKKSQPVSLKLIPAKVWLMCLHYCLFFICSYTFSVYISSYIITDFQLGTSAQSGMATALLTISAVLAGIFYSKIAKPLGKWLAPFFSLLMTIGYIICSTLTSSLAGCFIAAFLIGIGKTAIVPYVINQVSSRMPRYMMPLAISFVMGSMSLGMFLSKYITGWISAAFLGGETTLNLFIATSIIAAVTTVVGFLIYSVGKQPEEAK